MDRTDPLASPDDHEAVPGPRQPLEDAPIRVPEHPRVSANVELVGALPDSGYEEAQWLVRRDDRFVQVTELLYRVAEHADGRRTLDEIAERVTESTPWLVSGDNVRLLLQRTLIPLGIVAGEGAASASSARPDPGSALGLTVRKSLLPAWAIERATHWLQYLFAPPALVPLLVLIVAAHVWVYATSGLGGGIRSVLENPSLLLAALGIVALSGFAHEFGHAAALRYGGGRVGGMGVGLYLFFPAFYTDTTDNYRLDRRSRVRTDLGGFYFHLIFAFLLIYLYAVTGWGFLLVVVFLINLDVLYQLVPFVRLDGYWVLADLTGIPDFFSLMTPFLGSLLPGGRWRGARLPPLKPWVRRVFLAYALLTLPVLGLMVGLFLVQGPRVTSLLLGTLAEQATTVAGAVRAGDVLGAAAGAASGLVLALPLLGLAYLVHRLVVRPVRTLWGRRRRGAAAFVLVVAALLAAHWVSRLDPGVRGPLF